ncbi:MAG: aminoglycoside 6-adenylyltransferase [Firmicutes bacterium]|nr:aminoglycoside 6-adenylyltransferase [Bacillota bacterium]
MDLRGVPGIYNKALQPQWDVMTRVVSNLVQQAGVRTIYLEGSLARGTADAHSDVDLLVGLDSNAMRDIWTHRHQITNIPLPAILDLNHQWGDPAAFSYAVLYENGVYLDLTFVESPHVPTSHAVVLWSSSHHGPDGDRPPEPAMDVHPDPMDDALRLFWMGSPLCAKYLVRNQLWTALWFIESRRTLFLKAWRLAHAPARADWSWSKVHEDLPKTVLDDLAKTVTLLEYPALAQSLVDLMTMMQHHGPQLAQTYGMAYPEGPATSVAHMVSRMLGLE